MNELSLYILDLVQNSFRAKAKNIKVILNENTALNTLSLEIIDDGIGIDSELLKCVCSPFKTTRSTRKVGLGLSFFNQMVKQAGGSIIIESKVNEFTRVYATVERNHVDLVPLGNIADTLCLLTLNSYKNNILYVHFVNDKKFVYNSEKIDVKKLESDYNYLSAVRNHIENKVRELYL